MIEIVIYCVVGLFAGVLSGLAGIGGAVLIIPVLVIVLGFSQHKAQGTTLAMMIPPIGLLAALGYYKAGNVNLKAAGIMALTFFVGGLFGEKLANVLSEHTLKKIFGIVLLLVSLKILIEK